MARDTGSQTKRERKEAARREREELLRLAARRKRIKVASLVGVAALAAVAAVLVFTLGRGAGGGADLLTGPAPWPSNTAGLATRMSEAGLPALTAMEQLDFHIHQHLDISIDGNPVTVPANIGIDPSVGIAVLHTHDDTGIIHVESPEARDFTLGNFFDVWGVRLTDTCIGGYCNDGTRTLRVYVDGKPATVGVRDVVLTEHEEIVLAYGTESELPKPIPSSYEFPPGL